METNTYIRKANALRHWHSSEVPNGNGGNQNAKPTFKTLYCKQCGCPTEVGLHQTDKISRKGYPLVKATCGCGNSWFMSDLSYIRDNNNTTIGDFFVHDMTVGNLRNADMDTKRLVDSMGLLSDYERKELGIVRQTNDRSNAKKLVFNHPHFDGSTNFTIKCANCGGEKSTFYKIKDFRCHECNGRKYGYLKVNGEYQ